MSTTVQSFVLPVRNADPIVMFGEAEFTYVDISAVDRGQRKIVAPQVLTPDAAPSRARQVLAAGDVIVSTVRPNLNTVALVPEFLDGAIASTGFCVLRPNQERLDKRFLFHWISSESTVRRLVQQATGATYPAVSDKVIKSQPFSPPGLAEQQRIATILDKADSLRRKRQEAIRVADEFLGAVFFERFAEKPRSKVLTDYCDFLAGFAFKSDQYIEPRDGVRLLRGINVGIDRFEWGDSAGYPQSAVSDLTRYRLETGDVVLAMDRPWISTGLKCAVVDERVAGSYLVQRVARLRPKQQGMSAFIMNCLQGNDFKSHCRITETTIPHISPKDFSSFRVPSVAEAELRSFSELSTRVRSMTSKGEIAATSTDDLFSSLQAQFFAVA